MLYAIDTDKKKVRPQEAKGIAKDPFSGYPVVSKVKETTSMWIAADAPIDGWMLPDTEWSMQWRLKFPRELVEVIVDNQQEGKHIADVYTADGMVLKFQHRFLDIKKMRERERFFGKMTWILNASSWELKIVSRASYFCDTDGQQLELPPANGFEWVNYHSTRSKTIYQSCKCPVLLDLGGDYLHWINWQQRSNLQVQLSLNCGILKTFSKQQFLDRYTQQHSKNIIPPSQQASQLASKPVKK